MYFATQAGSGFLASGTATTAQWGSWGYNSNRFAVSIGLHQALGQGIAYLTYIYGQAVNSRHIVAILQSLVGKSLGKGPCT